MVCCLHCCLCLKIEKFLLTRLLSFVLLLMSFTAVFPPPPPHSWGLRPPTCHTPLILIILGGGVALATIPRIIDNSVDRITAPPTTIINYVTQVYPTPQTVVYYFKTHLVQWSMFSMVWWVLKLLFVFIPFRYHRKWGTKDRKTAGKLSMTCIVTH